MTAETQIQDMINNGQLINLNDKVTMQIFDAQIEGQDIAVFQLVGHSADLEAYVTMNYCASMTDARRFGEYLIGLADKYEQKETE